VYQKVLVPLDGVSASEYSLEHAKSIATGCEIPDIVLFRVVEPMPLYAEIGDNKRIEINANAETGAKEYLAKISKKLKKDDINVKCVVVVGEDPANEILDYVRKNKVDLIIMASHSHSGLMKWLLGSVAERVIRHSPVSVLLVSPENAKSKK
jgi:nucleotide-binding universal stress UspA family protein